MLLIMLFVEVAPFVTLLILHKVSDFIGNLSGNQKAKVHTHLLSLVFGGSKGEKRHTDVNNWSRAWSSWN